MVNSISILFSLADYNSFFFKFSIKFIPLTHLFERIHAHITLFTHLRCICPWVSRHSCAITRSAPIFSKAPPRPLIRRLLFHPSMFTLWSTQSICLNGIEREYFTSLLHFQILCVTHIVINVNNETPRLCTT